MNTSIFVNLAVADVSRTRAFYTGLGFTINETYSDDKAACIVISDTIYLMALREDFFITFLTDTVKANAHAATEAINCLTLDSPPELDELLAKVKPSGGRVREVAHQDGSMYTASFSDPDGHVWELVYMPEPA